METILDNILREKRREIAIEKKTVSLEQLRESLYYSRPRLSMSRSLTQTAPAGIIAEFKRRSPSKGFIHEHANPATVIGGYARKGAAACSVLTDRSFFGGSASDLAAARQAATDTPLLRKDFTIDPYQLHQAAAWGADAVLLIAAALDRQECRELACQARELKLEVLLEVHNEEELAYISPEVNMVGVNNRDLRTFRTDVQTSLRLAGAIPQGVVRVTESGIDAPQTVSRLKAAGYDGFLIGELFMREADPAGALETFLADVDQDMRP